MNIILHHSATARDKTSFRAINKYHKKKWNFESSLGYYMGYHYFINGKGKVYEARIPGELGAHTIGHNYDLGICMAGNFDIESPSPQQIYALRDLLRKLCSDYSISVKNIYPHYKYANKSCPGKAIDMGFIRGLVDEKHEEPVNDLTDMKKCVKLLEKIIKQIEKKKK